MAILELKNLDVRYGAIRALHGINISVEQGQIVAILGANGAGKSTTLRAISGLIRPTAGEVIFDGKPIHKLPAHKIVSLGISHVPEGRGIFPNFTVSENLTIGSYTRPRNEAGKKQIADDLENALGLFPRLRERLHQVAGTLSGGEQQMLALARALLARPRLLILDEPSLGLAPQIVQIIFQIIRQINQQGATILLVEQNVHMALQAAHHAYVLEVGHVAMSGDAKTLMNSDRVREAYLGVS
jgi:branched-chain amino acid transport system ATP-binding protein